jgi:hypothetical protein
LGGRSSRTALSSQPTLNISPQAALQMAAGPRQRTSDKQINCADRAVYPCCLPSDAARAWQMDRSRNVSAAKPKARRCSSECLRNSHDQNSGDLSMLHLMIMYSRHLFADRVARLTALHSLHILITMTQFLCRTAMPLIPTVSHRLRAGSHNYQNVQVIKDQETINMKLTA